MEEVFPHWIAALETGYHPLPAFERWADERIARLDSPPVWLIDFALTSSVSQAATCLWRGWEESEAARQGHSPDRNHNQCWLGFQYLRYERGDLRLAELLKLAGDRADVSDCGIDCEAFYYLLNEIDGRGPFVPNARPLAERVEERFAPFAQRAREATAGLPQYRT